MEKRRGINNFHQSWANQIKYFTLHLSLNHQAVKGMLYANEMLYSWLDYGRINCLGWLMGVIQTAPIKALSPERSKDISSSQFGACFMKSTSLHSNTFPSKKMLVLTGCDQKGESSSWSRRAQVCMRLWNDLWGKLEYLTVMPTQRRRLRSSLAFMNSNVGRLTEEWEMSGPAWSCRALC